MMLPIISILLLMACVASGEFGRCSLQWSEPKNNSAPAASNACEILARQPDDALYASEWNLPHTTCDVFEHIPSMSDQVPPISVEYARRCINQLTFDLLATFPHGFEIVQHATDGQIITQSFTVNATARIYCELVLKVTKLPSTGPMFVGAEIHQILTTVAFDDSLDRSVEPFNVLSGQLCTLAPGIPSLDENETNFNWTLIFYT
jgi:hypothetical protein